MPSDIFKKVYHGKTDIANTIENLSVLKIPLCKICGVEMGVQTPFGIIMSSCYIGEDICYDCQLEHCMTTNCLACKIGAYPNCKHLERKRFYLNEEE